LKECLIVTVRQGDEQLRIVIKIEDYHEKELAAVYASVRQSSTNEIACYHQQGSTSDAADRAEVANSTRRQNLLYPSDPRIIFSFLSVGLMPCWRELSDLGV
jgi:hypothetical protein